MLWGQVVDQHTLVRERAKLAELYRIKGIYETRKYRELPYIAGHGGKVSKIKEHYLVDEGTIGFVEVRESSHGRSVVNHLWNKRTIKRMIKNKQSSSKRKSKSNGNKKKSAPKTKSYKR
ncbi:MAG TPA: hypothetical protein VEA37_09070, partial [Flavobacterium sp.]|nr:hypothetical protein [Flavobacterium sp.]